MNPRPHTFQASVIAPLPATAIALVLCLAALFSGGADDGALRAAGVFVVLLVPVYLATVVLLYACGRVCLSLGALSLRGAIGGAGAISALLSAWYAYRDPFGPEDQIRTFGIVLVFLLSLSVPTALVWCRIARVR